MEDERWLPVVGLEGFYEVSDFGRVRTVERLVNSKGGSLRRVRSRVRKPSSLNGYPAVHLSAGGRSCMRTIHVLVLEAFVGPRPTPAHDGCHGDGLQANNRLSNLRWGTKKENKADSFSHGTAVYGERVGSVKLTLDEVVALRNDERSSRLLAIELGVSRSAVKRARNGRTWSRAVAELKGA